MKTGGGNTPWIELETPKPVKVGNVELYWADPPPVPSPRCEYWARQMLRGWHPNKFHWRMGYYEAAQYYGVYIWEWMNVLRPLIMQIAASEQ